MGEYVSIFEVFFFPGGWEYCIFADGPGVQIVSAGAVSGVEKQSSGMGKDKVSFSDIKSIHQKNQGEFE